MRDHNDSLREHVAQDKKLNAETLAAVTRIQARGAAVQAAAALIDPDDGADRLFELADAIAHYVITGEKP